MQEPAQFTTWIEDLEGTRHEIRVPPSAPSELLYLTPQDVPVSLRHTIRRGYRNGLQVQYLADVFDLPVGWVLEFIIEDQDV